MTIADDVVAERQRLVATLRAVGPDAPTLAGTWTARELASHLARQDRFGGYPPVLARRFATATGLRVSTAYLDRPWAARVVNGPTMSWAAALQTLSRPPPAVVLREPIGGISLWEHFVHHEDARRCNGVDRDETPDLEPVVAWIGAYQRRALDRTVRIVAETRALTIGTGPELTVEGPLAEVVVWLSGRPGAAIASDAPAEELERLRLRLRG